MSEFLTAKEFEKFVKENDARFYEYGRRIANLDSVGLDIEALKKSFSSSEEGHISSKELIHKSLDKNEENIQNLADKLIVLAQRADAFVIANESIKSSQDLIKSTHSSINASLRTITDKFANLKLEVNALYPLVSEIDVNKEAIRSFKASVNAQLEASKKFVQSILDEVSKVKEALEFLVDMPSELKDYKERTDIALKDLSRIDNVNACGFTASLLKQENALKADIVQKIKDIAIPETKDLATNSRVAKIESEIEIVGLDAKNALLKSGNVDLQTQLHAKKIENIQLLLKQYELKK